MIFNKKSATRVSELSGPSLATPLRCYFVSKNVLEVHKTNGKRKVSAI